MNQYPERPSWCPSGQRFWAITAEEKKRARLPADQRGRCEAMCRFESFVSISCGSAFRHVDVPAGRRCKNESRYSVAIGADSAHVCANHLDGHRRGTMILWSTP